MNLISSHCSQSLSLPWHWHFNISSSLFSFLLKFSSFPCNRMQTPILFCHTTSWSIYHMVNPLTISSSHGVLSTTSATISPPPLKTWDTENRTLQWKMRKLNCTWIYAKHNNSPGLFFILYIMQVLTARQKKMDVLTTHRSDLGSAQGFCEKLADNSSKCINENIISILFQDCNYDYTQWIRLDAEIILADQTEEG